MAPSHRRGRHTLSQVLDREVHQVVRKIVDERTQYGDTEFQVTFPVIYDEIKRSNSSLNRKPKKLLEDSIERVIQNVQYDDGEDEIESEDVELSRAPDVQPRTNGLNKSIVAAWSRGPATPTNEAAAAEPIMAKSDQPNSEPPRKKRKRTQIDHSPPANLSLDDMGGVDSVIDQFSELLHVPLLRPETLAETKAQPIRGILIHGPPGCGKTTIANGIAAEFGVNFISVSAPSIVSGMSGESEKALREYFEEAKKAAPCILFLDEIDAITPKRENSERQMEKRIVAQLATCMDDLDLSKTEGKAVIVLAATNRPESLDTALRRGGRFDKEIGMNVPNEPMRQQILTALTRKYPLSPEVDLLVLAKRTPGYVGADLHDLVSTAWNTANKRLRDSDLAAATSEAASTGVTEIMDVDIPTVTRPIASSTSGPGLTNLRRLIHYHRTHPNLPSPPITLTQTDFLTSLPKISPSALREGFATVPSTTFSSIGALTPLIHELTTTIIDPIVHPTRYASLGITPTSGCLLFGPPGCGKTLLARATANASSANFISVKGPELLNKYVGESERAVRTVFHRARSSVPVIIFFDELDALVPKRDGSSNDASSRVVNTLLTELDGAGDSRQGIYIIAATNRPDMIDSAILRPGRLETKLYVGLPDAEGRVEILKRLCTSIPNFEFSKTVEEIARSRCEGFSGADLESLKRRAGYVAVQRCSASGTLGDDSDKGLYIIADDFETALEDVNPSVSDNEIKRFEKLKKELQKTS